MFQAVLDYPSNMATRTRKVARRVGARLRARREGLARTLVEVGRAAKIDVSHLSKIERGEAETDLEGYARLAKVLGLDCGDLFASAYRHRV